MTPNPKTVVARFLRKAGRSYDPEADIDENVYALAEKVDVNVERCVRRYDGAYVCTATANGEVPELIEELEKYFDVSEPEYGRSSSDYDGDVTFTVAMSRRRR